MTKAIKIIALIIVFTVITIKSNGQTNWVLGGNSPTGTDTLGNITNQDLKIITNNKMQMTIKKSGKIGIGNAAPIFKLDVKSGSINTDSLYRINGVQVINRDASNNIQLGDNTAKVGIGTSTPTARLNILSDAAADAYLKSNNGSARITVDRGSQDSAAVVEFRTQGGNSFASTWKVGVFNPDLDADFMIIRTGGGANDTALTILKSTGNIGIGGHPSASKKLLVTGDAEITQQLRSGGMEVNGVLKITGGAGTPGLNKVFTSDANGNGSWQPAASGGGGITGSGATNRVAFWKDGTSLSSSTNLFWDSINFRLGLGTSSPATQLDVNGQIKISGGSPGNGKVLTSDANGLASWQTISGGGVLSGSGTASKLAFWDGAFTLNANNTLSWDNTNGRLGVGTASPTATLEVNGQIKITGGSPGTGKVLTSNASGLASWSVPNLTGSGNGGTVAFWNSNTSLSTSSNLIWNNTNGRLGVGALVPNTKLHIEGGTDASLSSGSGYMVIGAVSGENIVHDNNEIVARNNGATASLYLNREGGNLIYNTLGAAGNVGIGTNSPSQKLTVANGTTTGTYTTTGWVHSSDERLKTNIKHLSGSLDKIMKLNGVSYNWKDIPNDNNQVGFIAQDVEKIFPEVIVKDNDGSYGMAPQNLVAPVVEAIKEQQELIEQKEVAIKSLQLTVGSLQSENEKQEQQIEDLKKQMHLFESALSECCNNVSSSKETSSNYQISTSSNQPKLEQNIPNPFSENTVIKFYVPQSAASAVIRIYSLDGTELKSFSISSRGLGSIEISGKTFAAGTYTYMLIVNGKGVDTKQMILSK